jgi:hypothetical protein
MRATLGTHTRGTLSPRSSGTAPKTVPDYESVGAVWCAASRPALRVPWRVRVLRVPWRVRVLLVPFLWYDCPRVSHWEYGKYATRPTAGLCAADLYMYASNLAMWDARVLHQCRPLSSRRVLKSGLPSGTFRSTLCCTLWSTLWSTLHWGTP